MDNKIIYEQWLSTFYRGANGKKFMAVKRYLRSMSLIEKDLGMVKDEIYSISNIGELKRWEAKLRKRPGFTNRGKNEQASHLSALHVYENLIEILSSKIVRVKDVKRKSAIKN